MSEFDAENGSGGAADESDSALVSRLRLIEDRPLAERAAALEQVHAELRAALESGDAARLNG